MDGKRVAVVVSHPTHLLAVIGMQLRWKPDVLILNRVAAGDGVEPEAAIRDAFQPLGLADRLANLAIDEAESFDRRLVGYEIGLEQLDREFGVDVDVRGAVDVPHSALANEFVQAVAPVEHRPDHRVNLDERTSVVHAKRENARVSVATRITLLDFVHGFARLRPRSPHMAG